MTRAISLHRGSYPGRPAFDTALSRALLHRADRGEAGESLRLYRPDDVVAFSVLDRTRPGFARAVEAAREQGFASLLRLAGGRAAVFHRETLAFAWTLPDPAARAGIRARFDLFAGAVAAALARLGIDARVGEVPGEYCPGEHSVNARGAAKIMGVGQRVVRGAAHVGGVIVVGGSARVREVLVPVYRELGFEWDPATTGCAADEGSDATAITRETVAEALLAELESRFDARFEPTEPDAEALALAARLEPEHRPDRQPEGPAGPGSAPRPLDPKGKILAEGRLPTPS